MARIDLPPGADLEVVRALGLRPDLAAAVGALDQAVWRSGLDWRLHELVRMRVAELNQCTVCLAWRTPEAVAAGATDDLLTDVHRYRERDDLTPAEKVAIEYAERFCTDSTGIDDDLLGRLR